MSWFFGCIEIKIFLKTAMETFFFIALFESNDHQTDVETTKKTTGNSWRMLAWQVFFNDLSSEQTSRVIQLYLEKLQL